YLLRHVHTHEDGDFSEGALRCAHDAELANGLGNLLSRTIGLIERRRGGAIPAPGAAEPADGRLLDVARTLEVDVEAAISDFRLDEALARVWELVDEANRYVAATAPWRSGPDESGGGPGRVGTVLYNLAESLRLIAVSLTPFLPATAAAILRQLGLPEHVPPGPSALQWGQTPPGTRIRREAPLFPKPPR
ncbi:MAG: methionine--tRNA ligase, partial [Candidatus Binatia bacterium]